MNSYSTKDELDRVSTGSVAGGSATSAAIWKPGRSSASSPTVYDDERLRVVLTLFPRMKGHTIVIFKPHREDISEINGEETSEIFGLCVRMTNAIKRGLGAEKVYMNTMCDGEINHLHIQLFPRYPGERIGSSRFVAPRGPLTDGDETARRIRAALG